MITKHTYIFLLLVMIFVGCEKNLDPHVDGNYKRPELPDEPFRYTLSDATDIPIHINSFPLSNISTQITNDGATLGRVLFYDKALSVNNATSCGSCHKQNLGFADNVAFSTGFNTGQTKRNSPSCVNMVFNRSYFWDGRASTLEEQVLMPVADHIEMGLDDHAYLVKKVESLDYYEQLFKNAFGSSTVTPTLISSALTQFLKSMVSYNSKYDKGMQTEFDNFSLLEKEGFELFKDRSRVHCEHCHGGQNFSGWGTMFTNIGLDEHYSDGGVGDLEGVSNNNGVFKVPTLRNVALTAPYMHDGRFETLEEVIEHYNSGVKPHPNLDWAVTLQSGDAGGITDFEILSRPRQLNLTEREKQSLVAFLNTLTDPVLLADERFSDPFKKQ